MIKNLILAVLVFSLSCNFCATAQAAQAKKAVRRSAVSQADPNKEARYTRECNRLFDDYKFTEAWDLLQQAAEDLPESAWIAQWQGATLVQLQRYDEAIPFLKRSMSGPENLRSSANRQLARAYLGKKEYDLAIKYLKQTIRYTNSAYDYFLLADVYDQAGKADEAIDNFNTAIANSAKDFFLELSLADFGQPILYERRGYVYFKQGMLDWAKEDWKKVIELYPRYETAFGDEKNMPFYFDFEKRKQTAGEALAAAKTAQSSGNYAQAFQELEKAYAWMPARDPLTLKRCDKQIIEEFMNVYPKLSVKPALPESGRRLFVQANAHTKNKDYDAALKSYGQLLAVAPWYPEAWYNTALIRGEKKNYSDAIKNMKKYLLLVPNAADSRLAQDKIYEWEAFVMK